MPCNAAEENEHMTVEELIAALQLVEDKTMPVWAEGCDCANPASGVSVESLSPRAVGSCVMVGVRL